MGNKRVLQIRLDIVVDCDCDGYDLADEVMAELNRRAFNVVGASFSTDVTEFYERYYPDLIAD